MLSPRCPQRSQLELPLSIAASILICFALVLLAPARLQASNLRLVVGVPGASLEDNHVPAKATLQRVVHRKPVPYMPHAHVPEYLLVYVVETLECGHRVTVYPQADSLIASRRRCQECDGGEVIAIDALKKPSASVRIPNVERRRA
jgi:hypothetical protein